MPESTGSRRIASLRLEANHAAMAALGEFTRGFVLGAEPTAAASVADRMELAVHELAVNVADHAYAGRSGPLAVHLRWDGLAVTAELVDAGSAFDPASATDPDLDHPRVDGYGLFLVRALVDDLVYRRDDNRNHWTISINIGEPATPAQKED